MTADAMLALTSDKGEVCGFRPRVLVVLILRLGHFRRAWPRGGEASVEMQGQILPGSLSGSNFRERRGGWVARQSRAKATPNLCVILHPA